MDDGARRTGEGRWGGLDYAWGLDIGLERSRNEDALDLRAVDLPGKGPGLLVAVADGLGGGVNGDKAARTAVAEVMACADGWAAGAGHDPWEAARQGLEAAFVRADERIRAEAAAARERAGATTLVAALASADAVLHLYAGDSRLYVFGPAGMEYRTRDQTLAEIQLETGRIASEIEATPRQRNTLFSVVGGEPSGRRRRTARCRR